MSICYHLICVETKKSIWVGQGYATWDFYSKDPEVMEKLGRFLAAHEGKNLMLLADSNFDETEFEDFET